MFLIHTPPEHAEIVARAVVGACRLEGWQSPVQPQLLHTLFNRLLGQELDFAKIEPLSPAEVAGTLTTPVERQELIHLMVAIEILSNPIPERLERSVVQWATALHVHERALLYARDLARGALTKAVHDFYRLNWIGDLDHRSPEFEALLRHAGDKAYALTVDADAAEAARWSRARFVSAGQYRSQRLGVLPDARLCVSRPTRVRQCRGCPTRLDTRARRLWHDPYG